MATRDQMRPEDLVYWSRYGECTDQQLEEIMAASVVECACMDVTNDHTVLSSSMLAWMSPMTILCLVMVTSKLHDRELCGKCIVFCA